MKDFVQYQIMIGQARKLKTKAGMNSKFEVELLFVLIQNDLRWGSYFRCILYKFLYTRGSKLGSKPSYFLLIGAPFLIALYNSWKDTIRKIKKLFKKVDSIYRGDTIGKSEKFFKKVNSITIKLYTKRILATIFSITTEFFLYTRSKKRLLISV